MFSKVTPTSENISSLKKAYLDGCWLRIAIVVAQLPVGSSKPIENWTKKDYFKYTIVVQIEKELLIWNVVSEGALSEVQIINFKGLLY